MRFSEFLNTKGLPQSWKEIRESELGKSVFSVMEDESPINQPDICPEKDLNVRYGFSLGYAFYDKKLKDLTVAPIINNDPTKRKSTYNLRKRQNGNRN